MNLQKKPSEILQLTSETLRISFEGQELRSLVKLLLEEYWGLSLTDQVVDNKITFSKEKWNDYQEAIARIKGEEPWQYVLGNAWFYGRKFTVSPSVLIPRPETEELVAWILQSHTHKAQIIDIGTGSGCIPISLMLENPLYELSAIDISKEALAIARKNANQLGARVEFHHLDVLSSPLPASQYDIIVSNPPYIKDLEKSLMKNNVLDHEPHLALFVPNEDPLLFYRRIAELAKTHLKENGWLYFEINEAHGDDTMTMLEHMGFKEIAIKKDMQGKERMVRGRKWSL
jgi:release factor glutamine methyltransferase